MPDPVTEKTFAPYPDDYPFYRLPYLGQVFKLVQNDVEVEYATITGLKRCGSHFHREVEYPAFTAVIESRVTHAFRFYHNTQLGDWRPLSEDEAAKMRGGVTAPGTDKESIRDLYAALVSTGKRLDAAVSEINHLQRAHSMDMERIEALTLRLNALEKPATVAPPAPAAPQSAAPGRTPRVATQ